MWLIFWLNISPLNDFFFLLKVAQKTRHAKGYISAFFISVNNIKGCFCKFVELFEKNILKWTLNDTILKF